MAVEYVIVVGADFSEVGDMALEEAFALLSERPEALVHVVHVAGAYGPMLRLELPDDVKTVSLEEADAYLRSRVQDKATSAGHAFGERLLMHVRMGAPSDEIVHLGAELNADLIVVGTHGRTGVKRLLLGSVAEAVVRKSGCPVLVVRPKSYPSEAEGGAEPSEG